VKCLGLRALPSLFVNERLVRLEVRKPRVVYLAAIDPVREDVVD
jgi:hypothetical protein